MLYKTDSCLPSCIIMTWFKYIFAFTAISILGACAHPITINPSTTPQRTENSSYSTKVAGYVMTDADRAKQVTTEGGGGDKVNYFPYKDLEKGIRDVLKSLYSDVVLIRSPSDFEAIKRDGVGIVFAPKFTLHQTLTPPLHGHQLSLLLISHRRLPTQQGTCLHG